MSKPTKSKSKSPHPRQARSAAEGGTDKRVTSDRISEDLAAFRKSGGRIEVLGITRVLTRIDGAGE
ncbi:hypothetical protein QFW77_12070 [Luteimonas sp. RD2P54]|uniref:Uncharacterized protein n=1 Tax=Luteimonas endophytica TaxID=3042023 RepID=A0ABT6JA73_9GAMM|nr:hypothetical protein [Luteimonas endophytica]MDH5823724.1 hypothetical protein [Luteimonas endophytica]